MFVCLLVCGGLMEIQTPAPILTKFCTHIFISQRKVLVQVWPPPPHPLGLGGLKPSKLKDTFLRCSAGCKLTRAAPGTSALIDKHHFIIKLVKGSKEVAKEYFWLLKFLFKPVRSYSFMSLNLSGLLFKMELLAFSVCQCNLRLCSSLGAFHLLDSQLIDLFSTLCEHVFPEIPVYKYLRNLQRILMNWIIRLKNLIDCNFQHIKSKFLLLRRSKIKIKIYLISNVSFLVKLTKLNYSSRAKGGKSLEILYRDMLDVTCPSGWWVTQICPKCAESRCQKVLRANSLRTIDNRKYL